MTVKDIPSSKFILKYAQILEKSGKFSVPDWVDYVKTTTHKQLAPYEENWIFIRAASIARQVYMKGKSVGVNYLRTKFGYRGSNGTISDHYYPACGKIIRYCIQQLEKMGLIETVIIGVEDEEEGTLIAKWSNGRKVTTKGRIEMDRIAKEIFLEELNLKNNQKMEAIAIEQLKPKEKQDPNKSESQIDMKNDSKVMISKIKIKARTKDIKGENTLKDQKKKGKWKKNKNEENEKPQNITVSTNFKQFTPQKLN